MIPRKGMKLKGAPKYTVQISDSLSRPHAAGVALKYQVLKTPEG